MSPNVIDPGASGENLTGNGWWRDRIPRLVAVARSVVTDDSRPARMIGCGADPAIAGQNLDPTTCPSAEVAAVLGRDS